MSPPSSTVPRLRLQFVSGSRRGSEFASDRSPVRIGRSRDNDLVLPDEGAPASGRHHAEAVVEDGAWWLVDLGSAHGTRVNGAPAVRHRLRPGDRLALGDAELVVQATATIRRRGVTAAAILAGVLAIAALSAVAGSLLLRGRPDGFADAARQAARSTYLVTVLEHGQPRAFATAFVIGEDGVLVTAAHVVRELERRGALGQGAAIVRTEPTRDLRPILSARAHPDWVEGSVGNDVAVLRVAPGGLVPLRLAKDARVARLERGTRVGTLGFPAETTDARAPRARLAMDIVGDIRDGRYLSIDLNVAPGTSGSPIFLEDGEVVAIVAGGHFVPTQGGQGVVAAGSGVNWGVTTRVLRGWLR